MTVHSITSRHFGMLRPAALAVLAGVLLSACGGGGGGGGNQPPPPDVTITGRITFDRIPFDATLGTGLNPTGPLESPARQVTVQAIDAANSSVLATATTNNTGDYSVTVPANRNLFIRARAEMIKTGGAPTWSFSVRNNTTAGTNDALYALDGTSASSGTANSTRNLRAPTGFGTTNYIGERAAAPFAILDSVFRAKELILSATPNAEFADLKLFWSKDNKPTAGRFCLDEGNIGTTSYIVFVPSERDDCNQAGVDGIYILGDFAIGDTDEFDQSVIAHEFGHYVEDRFARSDSIGGSHVENDLLDLRVAFSEGWGNAFSSMALGDPIYRDSQQGASDDFRIDMETDNQDNEGWFSEASVEEILWDVFDATNEPGDSLTLGFTPIFAAMTGAEAATDALTSIFPFITGLHAANADSVPAIDALVSGEDIDGTGDFGLGESHNGGDTEALPIFKPIDTTGPVSVCSRSTAGNESSNKLGNRVFLRFVNDAQRSVTIAATGAVNGVAGAIAAEDPDIFVLRQGTLAAVGVGTGGTESINQVPLAPGTYIIEVYDFEITGTAPRCMTVSVTGT